MTDKTLDLLVRAQIQGGKDLEGVAKSISKIGDAIDEQNDAAKRGENRIDELKASLLSLEQVQKSLAGQSSAVKTFQKLAEGVSKADERVAKATKRYDEYKKKVDEAEEVTEAQQNTLIRYALAVEKSEAALRKQRTALSDMEAEFRDAGIAVEDLAARQQRSLQLQAELGAVYARGTDAVRDYSNAVREAREAQRAVDASTAEATRNADLFAKAEKRAADASRERARAAEEVAEAQRRRQAIQADRDAEVVSQGRGDDEFRAQAKRQAELAALRRDIEERSNTDAEVKGYQATAKAADDNAKALTNLARGKNTLSRAADSLSPKVGTLRDAIAGVLDPTTKARTTINGLESEVGELAAAVGAIKGPVTDYRVQVDRLTAAQKSLSSQAGLVDTFNRQVTTLRNSRAAFVQARASVVEYAAKVAQGGDGAAQFAQKLTQAQGQLRSASQALAAQIAVTRQSRDALRDAGIATNDLVGAQRRLSDVAKSTVASMTALDAATDRYGQAVGRTNKANSLFRDEGRTTLSFLQRLRGEVLSLVAAYGGLYALINTASGAINAASTREGVRNQLAISVGNDKAAIDAEYQYVKGQADRIGIEFERAIKGYAKFSAAATLAGRSRQEIRYIYETFSEVARVANISADDLDGVFKALEQITSKGKIQAEELRGQLGDRLFGAFEIAAKALKDQFPDLDKALKNGEVTAKQLVLIAEQYRKTVADQLPAATASLAAQQARLNTELFDFKLAVADSGFIDSYSNALKELTTFLRSDAGGEFAKTLGSGFKALSELLILVLRNIDSITLALKFFLILFTYRQFASGLKGASDMIKSFSDLKEVVGGFGKSFGLLQKSMAVLAAFAAGWTFGTYLREKFQIARDAGIWWVTRMMEAWVIVKSSYQAAFDELPVIARNIFNKIVSTIKGAVRSITRVFAQLAGAAGFGELETTLNGYAESISTQTGNVESTLGGHKAKLKAELAQIAAIRNDMLNESAGVGSAAAGRSRTAVPTLSPGVADDPAAPDGGGAKGADAIAKRQAQIEAIERALEAIEAKTDRAQTDTLAKQIEAIDTQYLALARRVEALGGDTGKVFMERLTGATNELKRVTTEKFNADLLAAQQGFLKKTEDLEEQAGRREKLKLESRLAAIVSDYDQAYRELAELRLKFFANNRDTGELDAMAGRLKLSKDQRLEQETNKFNTEELNRREQFLNDTIAAREKLVSAVNVQKELGNVSDVQAAQQINDINAQMVPKIEAAALATKEWAIANSAIFANPEQMQVFLATLEAVRAKATGVKTEFSNLNNTIINGLTNGVTTGLNAMFDALQQVATGQATVGEGFRGMLTSFAQFAASFLRDIAIMIIKLAIFNAMKNSGIPGVSQAGAIGAASMGVKHSGGVIGGLNNRSRTVSTAWFTNAPRYHAGGIAGLSPDEYPTILQKGEEVLEKDSPRNVLNGGAGMGQNTQAGGNTRFVLVDDRARVPEAMSSAEGERVIIQTLRKNIPTLKQYLK